MDDNGLYDDFGHPAGEPQVESTRKRKGSSKGDGGDKPSQATQLVSLAADADLWHDADSSGYATVRIGDHHEHHPIRAKAFRLWLARRYYHDCGGTPNAQAMQDALGVLEAHARFDGDQYQVYVRVGEHGDQIFIDLADPDWRVVEVSAKGWRILTKSPVRFRRAKAMLPLPIPERGGSIGMLRDFVNVTGDDWPLVLGWLVAALRPRGPYPVLSLHGEQGSAKSTTARAIRAIVDPNSAPVRCEPREARDLMIAANNGWLVALDNLSTVPVWLSDALCRLSTGGGFSTRTLYENDEETIFDAMRPTILTGIEEVATRGDLIDRSLLISLPTIPESARRPESTFWQDFDQAKAPIFGGLLDALGCAIRELPNTDLASLPRMADFALWSTAAEAGLGLQDGDFIRAYSGNRESANDLALESSIVAKRIMELASDESDESDAWTGTSSELLERLDERAGHDKKRPPRGWPTSAKRLSGELRRLAPNLRKVGIELIFWREPDRRRRKMITIRTVPDSCVRSVRTVRNPGNPQESADATGRNRTDRGRNGPQENATPDYPDASDATLQPHSANDRWGFPT